jgi:hypothetical protein
VSTHHIGYGSIQAMLDGLPRDHPVFVSCTRQQVFSVEKFRLQLQVIVGDEVHYVQIEFGRVPLMPDGEPFDNDRRAKCARAGASLLDLVRAWLKEFGWKQVRDAQVAVPKDLSLFETGLPDFVRFDTEKGEFVRDEANWALSMRRVG